jgi:lactoylglutathione lyase
MTAQSLFETHLTVTDLDKAIEFYTRVVGLRLAHVTPARQSAFLWIGGEGQAMLGLWTSVGPQRLALHTAFRVSVAAVLAAPTALRRAGLEPLDFHGRPTDEASVIPWMPAASVFFRDPDGHLLEYIAMLPDVPRPELGVMSWREWDVSGRSDSSERTRARNRDLNTSHPASRRVVPSAD